MKKLYTISLLLLSSLYAAGQITVTSAIVPRFVQGNSPTNNNRTPIWFWAELSGLTPNATYRFFTSMDSLNASPTSNGTGNAYLVNMTSGTIRRTSNVSLSNNANYDSLQADAGGVFKGWFGVEATGNGRYTPGNTLYPKIMLNNGSGGSSVANRILLSAYPSLVINYGTTSGNALQGSALYDSADVSGIPAKSFALLSDSANANSRPLSIAIVEDDGMDLFAVTSIIGFYRNLVDTVPQRWGTIIPNNNPAGVRAIDYRSFATAAPIGLSMPSDNDGLWCSGANTVNPGNGSTALYLDEYFTLQGTLTQPDTTYTGSGTNFTVNTNAPPGTQYSWDFGDGSPVNTNQNPVYTYTTPGTYTVTLTIQAPSCGIVLSDTIVVMLGTGIVKPVAAGSSFTVSPNPSNGFFRLSLGGNKKHTIAIVNLLGETVLEMQSSENSVSLDLNGKPKGIYLVRVQDEAGQSSAKKIMIR